MPNIQELKEYLVGDEGFLLDSDNDGKIIIISGVWDTGKTHFWKEGIEPILTQKLKEKEKTNVYLGLYGKESLRDIKQEIFTRASMENYNLSNEIEVFGYNALSSMASSGGPIQKIKVLIDLNRFRKRNKGKNKLSNGGVVCFDDFERKSSSVNLNDLFGFISRLSIRHNCKVVLILNNNVFEGSSDNIYKVFRDKISNKILYFKPTIKELFDSTFDTSSKYDLIRTYKNEILQAVTEADILNVRIYIQVMDNVLEWIKKEYDSVAVYSLSLCTIFYEKYTFSLNYKLKNGIKVYELPEYFHHLGYPDIATLLSETYAEIPTHIDEVAKRNFLKTMRRKLDKISKNTKRDTDKDFLKMQRKVFDDYQNLFIDFIVYSYRLKPSEGMSDTTFQQINTFIQAGILNPNVLKKEENITKQKGKRNEK